MPMCVIMPDRAGRGGGGGGGAGGRHHSSGTHAGITLGTEVQPLPPPSPVPPNTAVVLHPEGVTIRKALHTHVCHHAPHHTTPHTHTPRSSSTAATPATGAHPPPPVQARPPVPSTSPTFQKLSTLKLSPYGMPCMPMSVVITNTHPA
jgi:hypothetical protein